MPAEGTHRAALERRFTGIETARVLVIDDEPLILSTLSAFLELEGYGEVSCFECGTAALEHFAQHGADVILCDYLMPGLDGVEVLARARELDPRVPRILLTGYADKEAAIRAINEAGLFQYLEKPWSNDDLQLALRNALERHRLLSCIGSKAAELNIANARIEDLQRAVLRAFL